MSEPRLFDHADIERAINTARQALIEINMDLVVYVHHETEHEWLVSQDDRIDTAQWISKAEASLETDTGQNVLILPMALAIKKGFI